MTGLRSGQCSPAAVSDPCVATPLSAAQIYPCAHQSATYVPERLSSCRRNSQDENDSQLAINYSNLGKKR